MTVYATLDDPKLPLPKVGILRSSDDGIDAECLVCEKPLKIHRDKLYEIIDVFCSEKCLSKGYPLVEVPSFDIVVTKSQRGLCENCGGPPKGRGWVHKKDCSELIEVKPSRTCEECGGIARGRGYLHAAGCSKKAVQPQRSIRLCPQCNGPARGRGFIHRKGCLRNG